ncbi:MAG: diacylglycerol kinase family lipid kinase [Rhodospirillaceae bacterium]|nr:diacylglycerol kinase family lipid kinase [Rhodospirillaceae bacterium]
MDAVAGDAVPRTAEGSVSPGTGPRRILAVFNPAAGRNRRPRFNRIAAALKDQGCSVTVVETTAPGHAETIAREVSSDEFDVIAAAGGDGTVNEIVNGLRGKSIALGLIPLGTANVLADEIGLKRTDAMIARTLGRGGIRAIHVGTVNGRRFVMMAGAGFDANVVNGVSLALKRKLGPLAYVWQAGREAFLGSPARCAAIIDGVTHQTSSAVVCNGRRYGGPFIAAPAASLAEDRFHVVLMPGRGWFHTARYGVALMLGRISRLHDVRLVAGREVRIEGVVGRPVQADGDIVAYLPAQIAVDPEPVRLVFPV